MDEKRRYAAAQFGADNPAEQVGDAELQRVVFGDLPSDLTEVDPRDLLRDFALPEPEMESVASEETPLEQQAVRTTIVGGRPPGSGKPIGDVPRGIEVLVKKASVDPEFEQRLMNDPLGAAAEIELPLEPVERAMLGAVSQSQLQAIIKATVVPESHRRAFMGTTAAAMLIVLGGQAAGTAGVFAAPGGAAPDFPPEPAPDPFGGVDPYAENVTAKIIRAALGSLFNVDPKSLPDAPFVDARFNEDLQQRFRVMIAQNNQLKTYISPEQLKRWRTIADATNYIDRARMCQRPVIVLTAKLAGVQPTGTLSDKTLEADLKIDTARRATLRRALASSLRIYIPWETFKNLRTVDDVVVYVGGLALKIKKEREQQNPEQKKPPYQGGTFGNQPDIPEASVGGIRPEPTSRGARPDMPPMSFGIRPEE